VTKVRKDFPTLIELNLPWISQIDTEVKASNKPPGAPLGAASRPDSVGKQKKAQSMKKVFH
jgi:hypothetical protein